jgi:hypothetical protein
MKRTSDVDLVLSDWSAALERLRDRKDSPSEIRKVFAALVELSQKLTSVMRTEFPGKWEACLFEGWNYVSELFKTLRNHEQHRELIRQTVEEISDITVPAEDGFPEIAIGMSVHIKTVDPLSEVKPSSGIVLMAADPETGRMTNRKIGHVSNQVHRYMLDVSPDSETGKKIARLLKEIGTSDVHVLAEKYDKVIRDYHKFYKSQLH